MFNVQSWKKIKSLYATFKQRTGAYNGKINLKSSVEWAYLIGGKENQYIIKYNLPWKYTLNCTINQTYKKWLNTLSSRYTLCAYYINLEHLFSSNDNFHEYIGKNKFQIFTYLFTVYYHCLSQCTLQCLILCAYYISVIHWLYCIHWISNMLQCSDHFVQAKTNSLSY